ncbi:exosome complex component CSL4-like isoform X2 [Physella acuta]|uniref:exosome complex component CSL4-like isoform X2 n=1 Tax=Physella acuta TaxID=109671 RepID=UPI0027DB4C50|nr:exosome complex component CSL4-like isoform X2 [Physella acuta]
MADGVMCVPGQRLSRAEDSVVAGSGTYKRNGFIYASVVGFLEETTQADTGHKVISINTEGLQNVIPDIDAIVTARVTNVNPRFCKCDILSVGTIQLSDVYRGMIRKEDVRATEKDKVEMYKSFRPGDIIIARVISLGDSQSYILSTAENELGVAIGLSEAGVRMTPVSWCKMQCPKTLTEEYRKVAKVRPEFIKIKHES